MRMVVWVCSIYIYVYVEGFLFHTFMYRFWLLFKWFGVVLPFEFIVIFCVGGQAWISCSIVVFSWLRFCLSSCTIMGQLTGLVSRSLGLSTRPPNPTVVACSIQEGLLFTCCMSYATPTHNVTIFSQLLS